MNIDQYENKIIAYFEGELSTIEAQLLMDEVESDDGAIARVFDQYRSIYDSIATEHRIEVPSESMEADFDAWLHKEMLPQAKTIKFNSWKKMVSIAACFAIAIVGFQMYSGSNDTSSTYATLDNQLYNINNQPSPTERIKSIRVGYNESQNNNDNEVVNVLLEVLKVDQSSNVRLAAVETLANYTVNEDVRAGLISAIATEQDAFVKMAILSALGQHNNDKVKRTLENIASDKSQQKFVIDEAHMQLIKMDKVEI